MKLAFVVQRYGVKLNGGAELHCRWIAEHMRKYSEVEVLTTRALDYITWENHYPCGMGDVNGVPVRCFSVTGITIPFSEFRLSRRKASWSPPPSTTRSSISRSSRICLTCPGLSSTTRSRRDG